MFFDHQWINTYLSEPLSPETMARLLNATGLETEWSDHGLEVEHTVNRPDAMCHFGLARELSIKTGIPLVPPEIDHRPIAKPPTV
jgi:phenylalanyl-tRNA synthetase beta chain